METKQKTIKSVAQEMYDNFELKEREDKSKYYVTKESIQWQTDIIREAHLDRMPSDGIYDVIHTVICNLSDIDEDITEDDVRRIIYQMEADCYTSNLTKWLNSDNRNIYYLTQALEEYESKEGLQALSIAQQCFIQEIGMEVLNGIIAHLEEE